MAQRFDARLIGTWRSDRRRTFRQYKPSKDCTPQQFKRFRSLFGKLVIRWGRSVVHTELDGHRDSQRFKIIAGDSESVVIRLPNALTGEKSLMHIHFQGDCYWVATSFGMIEWFKRIPESN